MSTTEISDDGTTITITGADGQVITLNKSELKLDSKSVPPDQWKGKHLGILIFAKPHICRDGREVPKGAVCVYSQEQIQKSKRENDLKYEAGSVHGHLFHIATGETPCQIDIQGGKLMIMAGAIETDGKFNPNSTIFNSSTSPWNDPNYQRRDRRLNPQQSSFIQSFVNDNLDPLPPQNSPGGGGVAAPGGQPLQREQQPQGGQPAQATQNYNETKQDHQNMREDTFNFQDIPQGAYINWTNQTLNLFKRKDFSLSQEETDLIVYELMQLFKYGQPSFSLDPLDPSNQNKGYKKVYSCSLLKQTYVGQLMWRADWDLKQLSFGIRYNDQNGKQSVIENLLRRRIPLFKSQFQLAEENRKQEAQRSRQWFVIDKVIYEERENSQGKLLNIKDIKLGVKAIDMQLVGYNLQDVSTYHNADCKVFARTVSQEIETFCQIYKSFRKLRDCMTLWVIVKWYNKQKNRLQANESYIQGFNDLFSKKYQRYDFEDVVPTLNRVEVSTSTREESDSDYMRTITSSRTHQIQGGVSFQVCNNQFEGKKALFQDFLKKVGTPAFTNRAHQVNLFKAISCNLCHSNEKPEALIQESIQTFIHKSCLFKEQGTLLFKEALKQKEKLQFVQAVDLFSKSIQSFNQSLSHSPSNFDCLFNAGMAFMHVGQYELAISYFQKSISDQLSEDQEKTKKRILYLFRQLLQQRKKSAAIATFTQEWILDAHYEELSKTLGQMEKIQDLFDQGKEAFKKGFYQTAQERFEAALKEEGINQFSKTTASLNFNLSLCYKQQGKKKDEVAYLQSALKANLGHEKSKKNLSKLLG